MKKIISALDPRTKMTLTVFYAIIVVATSRLGWLATAYFFLMIVISFTGHLKEYGKWLRLVLPMSLFFGIVIWLTVDFYASVFAALKLLTLTSVFFAFFTNEDPEDLANSLVKMGVPYAIAFVMSTALQFVPIMGRKIRNVMDAQRARGIPLEPGWRALRYYPAFLSPILIQAFQLAEELAEAMEARGFGLPNRTFLKEYRMAAIDWILLSLSTTLMIAALLLI